MRYCSSCGNRIDENARIFPVCGAKTERKADKTGAQTKIEELFDRFTNTADTTAQATAEDIGKNKAMAVLAYLGLLFLVPLLAAKDSPFARYHTNQGILLFIVQTIGVAATQIPYAGWIAGALVNIFTTALRVIGVINAFKGEAKELPVIGKFRIIS